MKTLFYTKINCYEITVKQVNKTFPGHITTNLSLLDSQGVSNNVLSLFYVCVFYKIRDDFQKGLFSKISNYLNKLYMNQFVLLNKLQFSMVKFCIVDIVNNYLHLKIETLVKNQFNIFFLIILILLKPRVGIDCWRVILTKEDKDKGKCGLLTAIVWLKADFTGN